MNARLRSDDIQPVVAVALKGDARRQAARLSWRGVALAACCFVATSSLLRADDYEVYDDARGDAVVRRTDPGGDGFVDPDAHRLPDLIQITIGSWNPRNPRSNLYEGEWDEKANKPFLRVDVMFDGLINPPGTLDFGNKGDFDPFRFGPHPVFGFIEMDADENEDTGGEIYHPNGMPEFSGFPEFRYLGNGVRFGGVPHDRSELRDRFARSAEDFDGDCTRGREVEYSGEEFHIAFLGEEYSRHDVVEGEGDGIFEAGETLDLRGCWLHRAHGFEPFSFACGSDQGVYDPPSTLRWSHEIDDDQTTVVLVFPLTNRAAAAMRGDQRVERHDCDPFNQASIEEAMADLQLSARYWENRRGDCKRIIVDWADTDPEDELRARKWEILSLLATSYASREEGYYFVWTDILPNAEFGNVNGDSSVDMGDFLDIHRFIGKNDGGRRDGDGRVNGEVRISDFAVDFSVFDVDYDGLVGRHDVAVIITPGDLDQDGDVDLIDWGRFVECMTGPGRAAPNECLIVDFDFDGDVDLKDVGSFQSAFTGE